MIIWGHATIGGTTTARPDLESFPRIDPGPRTSSTTAMDDGAVACKVTGL